MTMSKEAESGNERELKPRAIHPTMAASVEGVAGLSLGRAPDPGSAEPAVRQYKMTTATLMGLYYGPKFSPAPGTLPLERAESQGDWKAITGVLKECMKTWSFAGTDEEAKAQAPVFISERIGALDSGLSVRNTAGYKAILDPITDEVIGHDYSGWVFKGEDPLHASLAGGNTGVYAAVFISIRKV